ncbi:6-phosphofructokinase [Thioalkalivibrio nitratireducens DSM 14787]|uniref:Pyrophosphate--fructose 6-phosphate 1-phosphotransferase n=1 Tax=Thioalkalivibrio nitratireducens (strain DSM 14787 / UNIQEM 213 / ALEN2) TaxID=1255043 RepID=L0E0Q7_THIND|nr:6-phosphofructokinase [Thioalkalivibrio nitratireducens]AGA35399.1 6-phosphofructokinase [Thioalkalivibrio nitratireducens DSM 14787]
MPKNALYAQSGGVTAVINASACGVIDAVRAHPAHFGTCFAARDGILGVLREEIIDLDQEDPLTLAALRHTPGGAFGSCRFDLGDPERDPRQYQRLVEVFRAHDIGYFFYNGGGGSMDTALKVARIGELMGYPITAVGVPKTIDNDLDATDTSPGFGSAAKFIATVVREASLDVESMHTSSTRVFLLEVMGRHAGWLAAAAALAQEYDGQPPMLILFAEVPFDQTDFLRHLHLAIERHGYCVVVVSEGLKEPDGTLFAVAQSHDVYAYTQLGGAAPRLADLIKRETGRKLHWSVVDYIQRAARHLASKVDVEQAYAVGKAAVEGVVAGHRSFMPVIRRQTSVPYRWSIGRVPLERVANIERSMPREFISPDGYGITQACRDYLRPLIDGEDCPPFENGLPCYPRIRGVLRPKRCPEFMIGTD